MDERRQPVAATELGFDAVAHGFRSSFRDYAAERTHIPHAVMEAALAHVVKSKAAAQKVGMFARRFSASGSRPSATMTPRAMSRTTRKASLYSPPLSRHSRVLLNHDSDASKAANLGPKEDDQPYRSIPLQERAEVHNPNDRARRGNRQ